MLHTLRGVDPQEEHALTPSTVTDFTLITTGKTIAYSLPDETRLSTGELFNEKFAYATRICGALALGHPMQF